MKLTFSLQTNKVGSFCTTVIEVDDEEWAELSQDDQDDYAKEMFYDIAMGRLGEWNWEES